ncbi:hypothetical protein E4T50_16940 [Aureobasidium sp. EXF-12298]|nr:hypothetical protein E4T50_16940 [Aureobasidium sp. EXF-12298]
MTNYEVEVPKVTTIANFRDVSSLGAGIKPGLLFRSGHIDDASRQDLKTLREQFGINSVIDLRGMQTWPYISIADKPGKGITDYAQQYPDHIASTSVLGLTLHYVSLFGPQCGRYMFSQVNLWDKAKSIAHVAISPANGLKHWQKLMDARMSKHRMYVSEIVLDNAFPQIKAVFKVLADPSSYPILILDKYGGDMVSIIISLTLFLLDSDMQSIHHDYMQTYQELAGLKEQLLKDIEESGMTEDRMKPFLPFVNSLQQHIQNKHGNIEQYLLNTGVDQSELQAMKRTLIPAPGLSEKHGCLLDI